uniref:Uncharacterized protein n=1 Tax=Timema shepardi TaxID=629360 RepID=A0A7R9AX76_TIMSH|nr:unnamed protein product [Timema shepardi]
MFSSFQQNRSQKAATEEGDGIRFVILLPTRQTRPVSHGVRLSSRIRSLFDRVTTGVGGASGVFNSICGVTKFLIFLAHLLAPGSGSGSFTGDDAMLSSSNMLICGLWDGVYKSPAVLPACRKRRITESFLHPLVAMTSPGIVIFSVVWGSPWGELTEPNRVFTNERSALVSSGKTDSSPETFAARLRAHPHQLLLTNMDPRHSVMAAVLVLVLATSFDHTWRGLELRASPGRTGPSRSHMGMTHTFSRVLAKSH